MRRNIGLEVLRIVGPYAVVAGAWIYVSDWAVQILVGSSPHLAGVWQTVKGLFFVLATSIILSYSMYRNLSLRHRKERELSEATEHYQNLVENVPGMVYRCLHDQACTMLYVSSEAESLTGYSPAEWLDGRSVSFGRLIAPEDCEKVRSNVAKAVAGSGRFEVGYRIRRKDGVVRHVFERSRVTGNVNGVPILEGFIRDVTDRHRQNRQLREQMEELSALNETMLAILDNAPVMTGFFDFSGRLKWVNRGWIETLGWSREEIEAIDLFAECYPEFDERARVMRHIETADGSWADFLTRRKDGRLLRTSWANLRLSDGSGIGIGIDLTEQRRLEDQRNRFFEQSLDLLCIAGFDGVLREVNPAWSKTLGWSEAELTSRPWLEFIDPEDRGETSRVSRELQSGQPVFGFENRCMCRDGSVRRLVWNVYPSVSEQLIYGVVRDVTEVRLLEKQLFQSQKMEAVGRFASGIAHDFNNVLTAILWTAEIDLSGSWAKEAPERAESLKEIRQCALKGGDLTRKLLLFGRQEDREFGEIEVHELLTGMVRMVSRMMEDDIEIEVVRGAEQDRILGDSTQIEQVMMNLLLNARDAMPDGGQIVVTTRNLGDVPSGIKPGQDDAGRMLEIEVRDTGTGMDDEVLKQIFDPFFTTKERGRGTGLGLSTVYAIVQRHQGRIDVESEPGNGTTFRIAFPLNLVSLAEGFQPEELIPGAVSILLVEDDARVRSVTSKILSRSGYGVQMVETVAEAQRVMAHGFSFNLLITDIHLPDGNGVALAVDIRNRRPELPILFISGDVDVEMKVSRVEGSRFLRKPFKSTDLLVSVEEVLTKAAGRRRFPI